MTIQEIRNSDKLFLTCSEIAPLLRANPATIHLTAMQQPERLGFPVTVAGNRVHIPRIPFLRFLGIETEDSISA